MDDLKIPAELLAYIPVMVIILQACKRTPAWRHIKAWVGAISLGVGVAVSYLVMPDTATNAQVILGGLLLGAAPSGIYEAGKKVKGAIG